MTRFKLTIEYDGSGFVGWQRQENGLSVQQALEEAIVEFSGQAVTAHGAGRTDSGVHALGQVVHIDLDGFPEPETVRDAINFHLKPAPVAVLTAEAADGDFHARFSATQRAYVYRIANRRAPLAVDRDRAWWVPTPLDTEAMAAAEFFRGLGLFLNAKQSGDPALWARIDELLLGYPARYPTQDVLVPWTMQMVFDSRLARDDRAGARTMIDNMLRAWPDSKRTGASSGAYYNSLLNYRRGKTGEEGRAILSEMAGFLKIGNNLGSAPFKSLRNESRHWLDLGDYAEAERVLIQLVGTFGEDAQYADQMDTYILPDLGRTLLSTGKVADAKAILNPLVMDEGATPSKATVLNWSRSIAGWLSGAQLLIKEVPGAGGSEEEWTALIAKLDQISKAGDKWTSCEWYEVKLMIIFSYHSWSMTDDRKRASAQKQLFQMDAFFDDPSYAAVGQYCDEAEGQTLERLGDGVLKSRYLYMARLLR